MPANIDVILQQDVANLGKIGEVVHVRPGYARNYLLPRQLASAATIKNIKQLEHQRKVVAARHAKAKAEAQESAAKLSGIMLSIARRVGENDKLYGAVTSKEIESALSERGISIDRRKLQLSEPIKALGQYEVPVKLGYETTAIIKVSVVKA